MSTMARPIPAPSTPPRFTAEDLLRLPNSINFELVDGQLVERKMGFESSWIGGQLFLLLAAFCNARRLGWVAPADASYQCFPDDPEKVRRPDVSFVRLDRLPGGPPKGHCGIAPDLAVEVISPNELYSDVEVKVDEYLAAGVRLVWVVDPLSRSVRVHRADGTVTDLREADELSGEDVVPGFRCAIANLFASPMAHAPKS